MENPSEYFDSWVKTQQQAFTMLRDQALQMQSLYQNTNAASENPFTNWSKAVFQAFPMHADADLAKDTFSKTLYGNAAMQKLYELWQPLLNAMRDKTIDPASYSDLTDPTKIKQLIEKLFNFDLEAMNLQHKQLSQYADLYQQFGKPWTDAFKNQSSNFTQNDFQPESIIKQVQAAYSMFENSTGKLFSVPAVGKDREKMELMSKCAKAFSEFTSANIDYQKLMQTTGGEAMQSVIKTIAEKVNAGEKVGIVGPSGSGKSTLLAAIAGFLAPTEGAIRWQGQDLIGVAPGDRPRRWERRVRAAAGGSAAASRCPRRTELRPLRTAL